MIVMRTNQPPRRTPNGSPSAGFGGAPRRLDAGSGRGERHRISSCSRNCRTFQTITGTTARKSTTAMAAARPSWLP